MSMDRRGRGAWVLSLACLGLSSPAVGAGVLLQETAAVGSATRFQVEMKAEGVARPAGAKGGEDPKALALRVETRLVGAERVLQVDPQGRARKTARHVEQAASAINGEVRPTAVVLRPGVALLVAELRSVTVVCVSPSGPLQRQELELVEGPADPLVLAWLLPGREVAVGDRWVVGEPAARSLSSYDALASNALEATLESLNEASARIKLSGEIRGAVLGGEGSVACSGYCIFDRKQGRVTKLELQRKERRKPGPVEAGLDLKSELKVERTVIEPPPALADGVVAALPAGDDAQREELLFVSRTGKFTLRHDRAWHLFADDQRQAVFKRLDHGELVAQCNLANGPSAGKGRHQDLEQFRGDIQRGLGARFGRVTGAGELEGFSDGTFRYRVAVEGHEGEVRVVWYYYLIASPEGDQLLAAFTLGQAQAGAFADHDLRLIGSLEWLAPRPDGPAAPADQ